MNQAACDDAALSLAAGHGTGGKYFKCDVGTSGNDKDVVVSIPAGSFTDTAGNWNTARCAESTFSAKHTGWAGNTSANVPRYARLIFTYTFLRAWPIILPRTRIRNCPDVADERGEDLRPLRQHPTAVASRQCGNAVSLSDGG